MLKGRLTNLDLYLHSANQIVEMLVQMCLEHFVQILDYRVTSIIVHVEARMNYAIAEDPGNFLLHTLSQVHGNVI